uniref:Uncharacterized protein n=1 Tax=Rhizophora mucronata TaxID=61149 RepID=A0A2P2Q979_RHIMU
MLSQTPILEF